MANFLKSILCVKTGELEANYWIVIEKWYIRWLRLLLPGRIYIAPVPWQFGHFCNIFLPSIGEDQKKSYDLSEGPLAGTAPYYGQSGPG